MRSRVDSKRMREGQGRGGSRECGNMTLTESCGVTSNTDSLDVWMFCTIRSRELFFYHSFFFPVSVGQLGKRTSGRAFFFFFFYLSLVWSHNNGVGGQKPALTHFFKKEQKNKREKLSFRSNCYIIPYHALFSFFPRLFTVFHFNRLKIENKDKKKIKQRIIDI